MDIRMIKDILRLKYQGDLSHDRIAQSLSISKGAVAKYLSLAGAASLDWASTVDLDEAVLERRLMVIVRPAPSLHRGSLPGSI
jgi:predicted transcriptional regulator